MTAPNIRNGVHIVAETDHYQLLNLDNDDSRLGFGNLGIRSLARRIARKPSPRRQLQGSFIS